MISKTHTSLTQNFPIDVSDKLHNGRVTDDKTLKSTAVNIGTVHHTSMS